MDRDGSGYFLYHSVGQYPGKAADLAAAMADFARVWGAADDGQWEVAFGLRARFLARWRAILGAPEGSLTTCENVTQGLAMAVSALPPSRLKGKRVLIAADAFPSNHFLLSGLAGRLGFALETVPIRPGAAYAEDEDMIARWGPDVALALITWTSSTTSHRSDLGPLVSHGRRMGSLIAVDITQSAGLIPFSVAETFADIVLATSLKWVCGTTGAGVLYMAPALICECRPFFRGWFSQEDPFSWALDRFTPAPDIRRFDSGTPGIVAAAASLPALDWHAKADRAAILAHNRRLAARIIAGAEALGLKLLSPRPSGERGGSVMIALPEARSAAEVVTALRARGLWADARGQILRLSPGVMTTEAGTEHLIEALGALLGRSG